MVEAHRVRFTKYGILQTRNSAVNRVMVTLASCTRLIFPICFILHSLVVEMRKEVKVMTGGTPVLIVYKLVIMDRWTEFAASLQQFGSSKL